MGLTIGLCDAGGLADCLIGVFKKGCEDASMDKYAEIRKEKFLTVSTLPFITLDSLHQVEIKLTADY